MAKLNKLIRCILRYVQNVKKTYSSWLSLLSPLQKHRPKEYVEFWVRERVVTYQELWCINWLNGRWRSCRRCSCNCLRWLSRTWSFHCAPIAGRWENPAAVLFPPGIKGLCAGIGAGPWDTVWPGVEPIWATVAGGMSVWKQTKKDYSWDNEKNNRTIVDRA